MTNPEKSEDTYEYVGSELELFSKATNWKRYLYNNIKSFIGPEVLEVGAGLGGTTKAFCKGEHVRWVCLEPDDGLSDRIRRSIDEGELPSYCTVVRGVLDGSDRLGLFDTILYIDVLEHIENDRDEILKASASLKPGGCVVVLSPAHQWLFTPFDRAIGHYRRYSRRSILAAKSDSLENVRVVYLDSVGMLASLANKILLKSARPTLAQIAFWDRVLVPMSRLVDSVALGMIGKSVLAVWRKRG